MPIAGDSVRLDAAVDRLLVQPVDRVTRAGLVQMRQAMRNTPQAGEALDPPSLGAAVLEAVMPRIGNPSVLRHGNAVRHLERLRAWLASRDGDGTLIAGGRTVIEHELRNLSLLRRHRDRLIEG